MSKEIQNWADDFMFSAEKSDAMEGPRAFLLAATPDPLGSIAVAAEAYMGRFYEDKSAITDEQRRYYLKEMQKTKLKMPMEAVSLHWRLKGVTRSFTHQMVRQRTAAYSQESMRFAVKEDAATAVALPPSLQQFNTVLPDGRIYGDHIWEQWRGDNLLASWVQQEYPSDRLERHYIQWREAVEFMGQAYTALVNDGMPAEEARGLTPHNIVTQLNYITNLRNYQDHAGNRLCTQAQFEWRNVWTSMLMAMRAYCTGANCHPSSREEGRTVHHYGCDNWQWVEISQVFRPACYYAGQCVFGAEFDRKCSIRERVQEFASHGVPSSQWEHGVEDPSVAGGRKLLPIHPAEWLLDAAAAR